MTTPIFPSLPGLGWSVTKTPRFASRVQKAVAGRELIILDQPYPKWDFTLTFPFLRDGNDVRQSGGLGVGFNELRQLMGLFAAMPGQAGRFLFQDPSDDTVVGTVSPTGTMNAGDGVTTQFQLYRQLLAGTGQLVEPVIGQPTVTHAYVNGVDPGGWTVSTTGTLTWGSAPALGAVLTWSGSFYFLCRFSADSMDFENFMFQLWSAKEVKFESVLL